MEYEFTKMSGAGNDFIVIDNRDQKLEGNFSKFIQKICRRRFSIGSDGVLLLENSKDHDFRMRYFNADGGEVEMCGNGGRCIAKFAYEKGVVGKEMTFESVAGIHSAEIIGKEVKLGMTKPEKLQLDFALNVDNQTFQANFINTGVSHVVIFVEDIENFDVTGIGEKIRYHERFQPAGTNANFVEKVSENIIRIRTYERGVEDETLACGTGATAAGIIAFLKNKIFQKPVIVKTRGGFELKIYFEIQSEKIKDVFLQGQAEISFNGIVKKES